MLAQTNARISVKVGVGEKGVSIDVARITTAHTAEPTWEGGRTAVFAALRM